MQDPISRGVAAGASVPNWLARRLAALSGNVVQKSDLLPEEKAEIQKIIRGLYGLQGLTLGESEIPEDNPWYQRAKEMYLTRRDKWGMEEALSGRRMKGREDVDELQELTGIRKGGV